MYGLFKRGRPQEKEGGARKRRKRKWPGARPAILSDCASAGLSCPLRPQPGGDIARQRQKTLGLLNQTILRRSGWLARNELRLRIRQCRGRVRQCLFRRSNLGGIFGRARHPKSDLRLHKRLAGNFHRRLFGCGRRQPQRDSSGDEWSAP